MTCMTDEIRTTRTTGTIDDIRTPGATVDAHTTGPSDAIRTTPRRRRPSPARVPSISGPPRAVRVTARGRVVVLLVVLVAALTIFALRSAPAASTDVVHHPRTVTVVVAPGETVWDIARRFAPNADPRAVVAEIEELNALADAGSIRVGQPLAVPRS